VKYIKPTPIDCTLQIRGRIMNIEGKKVTIDVDVVANGIITVKGEVVAIQVPDKYIEDIMKSVTRK
jgi:predicted thioesterase